MNFWKTLPKGIGSSLQRYDILFIGTERCEASIHFTVTDARFIIIEDGIDGSRVIFESNGGETRITSSDALVIIQDDEDPYCIYTIKKEADRDMTTTTSRFVEKTFRNQNLNPVIDVCPRW